MQIVIFGGGYAAVNVLKGLQGKLGSDTQITLVSDQKFAFANVSAPRLLVDK